MNGRYDHVGCVPSGCVVFRDPTRKVWPSSRIQIVARQGLILKLEGGATAILEATGRWEMVRSLTQRGSAACNFTSIHACAIGCRCSFPLHQFFQVLYSCVTLCEIVDIQLQCLWQGLQPCDIPERCRMMAWMHENIWNHGINPWNIGSSFVSSFGQFQSNCFNCFSRVTRDEVGPARQWRRWPVHLVQLPSQQLADTRTH